MVQPNSGVDVFVYQHSNCPNLKCDHFGYYRSYQAENVLKQYRWFCLNIQHPLVDVNRQTPYKLLSAVNLFLFQGYQQFIAGKFGGKFKFCVNFGISFSWKIQIWLVSLVSCICICICYLFSVFTLSDIDIRTIQLFIFIILFYTKVMFFVCKNLKITKNKNELLSLSAKFERDYNRFLSRNNNTQYCCWNVLTTLNWKLLHFFPFN